MVQLKRAERVVEAITVMPPQITAMVQNSEDEEDGGTAAMGTKVTREPLAETWGGLEGKDCITASRCLPDRNGTQPQLPVGHRSDAQPVVHQ